MQMDEITSVLNRPQANSAPRRGRAAGDYRLGELLTDALESIALAADELQTTLATKPPHVPPEILTRAFLKLGKLHDVLIRIQTSLYPREV
jgi:hypothetical protein